MMEMSVSNIESLSLVSDVSLTLFDIRISARINQLLGIFPIYHQHRVLICIWQTFRGWMVAINALKSSEKILAIYVSIKTHHNL